MNLSNLSEDESKFICFCINAKVEGQHPHAELFNLEYFTEEYIEECLNDILDEINLNKEGLSMWEQVTSKLY